MELKEEIEITCKKCDKTQNYHPRGNKIPKRPKTQCQNCEAWIYFDGSLLVKNDQKPNDQTRSIDQKTDIKTIKATEKTTKPKIKKSISLTKNDQMTKTKNETKIPELQLISKKNLSSNQIQELIEVYREIQLEFQTINKIIPLSKKMEIINWILNDIENLYEGTYYYLKAWKARYNKRLNNDPYSPVITKYEAMEETFEKIKEIKKLKEEIPYAKNRK